MAACSVRNGTVRTSVGLEALPWARVGRLSYDGGLAGPRAIRSHLAGEASSGLGAGEPCRRSGKTGPWRVSTVHGHFSRIVVRTYISPSSRQGPWLSERVRVSHDRRDSRSRGPFTLAALSGHLPSQPLTPALLPSYRPPVLPSYRLTVLPSSRPTSLRPPASPAAPSPPARRAAARGRRPSRGPRSGYSSRSPSPCRPWPRRSRPAA